MSTMHVRRRNRTDVGAALVLTLVMTVVFALVAVAIAGYAATALKTTRVSEGRVDRLAAADSGMQETLVQLDSSGTCPASLGDRNGATLSVVCEVRSVPLNNGSAPFGLILTALGLNSGTDAFKREGAAPNTINVGGEVFVALAATGHAKNVQATGHVISQATDCPDDGRLTGPQWLGIAESECTEQTWQAYTQTPSIPFVTPASVPEPSGCQRLHAGDYDSLTVKGDAYFASGIYRIRGRLNLEMEGGSGRITAGHNGSVTLPSDHDCFLAQTADVDSEGDAEGVVFVLENDGHIAFTSPNTSVEFYGLQTGDRRLSVVAYGPGGSGFEAPGGGFSASGRAPQTTPVVEKMQGGSTTGFRFFGEVWAPRGYVHLEKLASNDTAAAAFQGGTVISRFVVDTSSKVTDVLFGGGEALMQTYTRARVTATSPDGTTTTVSAVTLRPPESDLRVLSWRVL